MSTLAAYRRPALRDLRPLAGVRREARGHLAEVIARIPRVRPGRPFVLACLPVTSALFAVAAAWSVAQPLGLAVASVACLLIEHRFSPEE